MVFISYKFDTEMTHLYMIFLLSIMNNIVINASFLIFFSQVYLQLTVWY